jgi:hypothetical protein
MIAAFVAALQLNGARVRNLVFAGRCQIELGDMPDFFTQDYAVVPTTAGENQWLGRVHAGGVHLAHTRGRNGDSRRHQAGRLKPTMRQTHIAGEKLFVDFAGRTGEVVDGFTGEIIPVQIFVAVLGASNFTYAEAVWSQKLPIGSRRMSAPSRISAASPGRQSASRK